MWSVPTVPTPPGPIEPLLLTFPANVRFPASEPPLRITAEPPIAPPPLSVAPLATVTAVLPNDPPTVSEPCATDVAPVYVFTPPSVVAPVPACTNEPVPLITPL